MIARVRDTEIYFDIDGAGLVPDGGRMVERPVIFLPHGGPGGDHSSYKTSLAPLADRAQLVYFDHRGQGRSARGDRKTYTLENNVEDMEALRRYLGLGRIAILGASYGGMVALSYAVRYPQHVSHLIAVVTAASYRFLDRAKQILAERGTPQQRAVAEKLWAGNFAGDDELVEFYDVMGPLYSLTHDPAKAKLSRARTIRNPETTNEAFGGFLRTYDVTAELSKITCPTLVIGARHDWICAPEFSEEIAARITHADLRIFENSAHGVYFDEPRAFLDVVRGFLVYNKNGGRRP